jgi:hypothetical protein
MDLNDAPLFPVGQLPCPSKQQDEKHLADHLVINLTEVLAVVLK